MNKLFVLLWVIAGGICGTVLRFALTILLEQNKITNFPLGTFIINLGGCFAFGFVSELSMATTLIRPELKLALTTGFAGAFTTFSTFMFDNYQLARDGQLLMVLVYTGTSMAGGGIFLYAGVILARAIAR